MGRPRRLNFALEVFWSGKSSARSLLDTAKAIRRSSWIEQRNRGVSTIPSNDFSLYDHVLDTAVMVGAIPERYGWPGGEVSLDTYFAMAKGSRSSWHTGYGSNGAHTKETEQGVAALEMAKWFDTGYHYMVPELSEDQAFSLTSTKPVEHFHEAMALGFRTRPVVLGPVTFLKLAKPAGYAFNRMALLPKLLPVYTELLKQLRNAGVDWAQIYEPCLALDLDPTEQGAIELAYGRMASDVPGIKIMLSTYFGEVGDNLDLALALPVAGLHLDIVRKPEQLPPISRFPHRSLVLSLGLIDSRNIWSADMEAIVKPIVSSWPTHRVQIAPSCSLLHVPINFDLKTDLDDNLHSWLALGVRKIDKLAALTKMLEVNLGSTGANSAKGAVSRRATHKMNDPLRKPTRTNPTMP